MYNDFFKNKKIFITGSTGFKGSWLSLWLLKLGAVIKGYSLKAPTVPSLYEKTGLSDKYNTVIADVRDREKISSEMIKFKPEIVIHLAAQALVRHSYYDPVTTYETNIMGTVNLFEAVRKCDSVKAVLNVTSDKCYENIEKPHGYIENEPLGGDDPYSSSKAGSELITKAYSMSYFNPNEFNIKHNTSIATARAGNIIGGGDWADDRLIPDIIKSLSLGKKVVIRNPYSIRPWQHVVDSLNGYLMLCKKLYEYGPEYSGGWNFGPEDNNAQNVLWIVNRMCSLLHKESYYIITDEPQPYETVCLKLDISKAKKYLKWKPLTDINFALKNIASCFFDFENIEDYCLNTITEFEKRVLHD